MEIPLKARLLLLLLLMKVYMWEMTSSLRQCYYCIMGSTSGKTKPGADLG